MLRPHASPRGGSHLDSRPQAGTHPVCRTRRHHRQRLQQCRHTRAGRFRRTSRWFRCTDICGLDGQPQRSQFDHHRGSGRRGRDQVVPHQDRSERNGQSGRPCEHGRRRRRRRGARRPQAGWHGHRGRRGRRQFGSPSDSRTADGSRDRRPHPRRWQLVLQAEPARAQVHRDEPV